VVSFTHEQNIICSQTQLDDIAHEQTIICRQLFAGHVVGFRLMKRKKNKVIYPVNSAIQLLNNRGQISTVSCDVTEGDLP